VSHGDRSLECEGGSATEGVRARWTVRVDIAEAAPEDPNPACCRNSICGTWRGNRPLGDAVSIEVAYQSRVVEQRTAGIHGWIVMFVHSPEE
jgi:hypothetical protein